MPHIRFWRFLTSWESWECKFETQREVIALGRQETQQQKSWIASCWFYAGVLCLILFKINVNSRLFTFENCDDQCNLTASNSSGTHNNSNQKWWFNWHASLPRLSCPHWVCSARFVQVFETKQVQQEITRKFVQLGREKHVIFLKWIQRPYHYTSWVYRVNSIGPRTEPSNTPPKADVTMAALRQNQKTAQVRSETYNWNQSNWNRTWCRIFMTVLTELAWISSSVEQSKTLITLSEGLCRLVLQPWPGWACSKL